MFLVGLVALYAVGATLYASRNGWRPAGWAAVDGLLLTVFFMAALALIGWSLAN